MLWHDGYIIKSPIIVHPIKTDSIREPIHRNPFGKISNVLPKTIDTIMHISICVCVCMVWSNSNRFTLWDMYIWVQIFRVTNKTNSIRNRDTFPIPKNHSSANIIEMSVLNWSGRWWKLTSSFEFQIENCFKYIIPFDFPFKSIILTRRVYISVLVL